MLAAFLRLCFLAMRLAICLRVLRLDLPPFFVCFLIFIVDICFINFSNESSFGDESFLRGQFGGGPSGVRGLCNTCSSST